MHRSSLLLLALGALTLPGTAAAGTYTATDYAVTIEGTADYNRADADAEVGVQHDAAVAFTTTIPRLTFHGVHAEDSRGAKGTATVSRGAYVITGPEGEVRCTAHDALGASPGRLGAIRGAGGTTFATRVTGGFTLGVGGCSPAVMQPWTADFGAGDAPLGGGIFDSSFTVPSSRVGEPSMRFELQGEVTGQRCPIYLPITVLCSLTWDAVVTFTRTGTRKLDDEVAPVPIVKEPKPDPAQDDDLLVPLDDLLVPLDDLLVPLAAKARLTSDMSRASLPIVCAESCRGTVTATAGARTLARRAFTAAPGATAVAAVRFDRADRRAIGRAGKVRLTVRATSAGREIRRAVTLRAR